MQPTHAQKTIENMYINCNKNRVQPCKDSVKDEIRFLFYDLRTCIDDSDHTQPLLVTRHNVSAGMVLVSKLNLLFSFSRCLSLGRHLCARGLY